MRSNPEYFRRALILFIWFVTGFDVYCLQYIERPSQELNPLGALLISLIGVWGFAGVKIAGTAIATEWLRSLKPFYTYVIAALELVLLIFLWSF